MTDIVIKRGPGRPSKKELEERAARAEALKPKPRTDDEILTDLNKRFNVLSRMTKGTVDGVIRALVVAGAPGVGKTYTVENILNTSEANHVVVRGTMSAIKLYELAYAYKDAGNVLVLDDADGIFNDEDALNILKALCDTSMERKVSYRKDANLLKENDIPDEFVFNGSMIFISNLDFQTFIDEGRNKYALHFEALMSRSLYLELRLHSRAEIGVWVNHIAETGRIFDREGVPKDMQKPLMQFIATHRETLRDLSIRTLLKLAGLAKSSPETWEDDALVMLVRPQ